MLWCSISFTVLLTLWTFWMWTVWCCRTVLHYTNRCFWYVADPRWYKLDGQNNRNCGCNHIFILTFCLSGSTSVSRGIWTQCRSSLWIFQKYNKQDLCKFNWLCVPSAWPKNPVTIFQQIWQRSTTQIKDLIIWRRLLAETRKPHKHVLRMELRSVDGRCWCPVCGEI